MVAVLVLCLVKKYKIAEINFMQKKLLRIEGYIYYNVSNWV